LSCAEWRQLCHELSEWSGYFFSDNIVSNESSFLQPATALTAIPPGLAYLGVGPEQTFSYLAIVKPSLAFVIDLRRDNFRLHLLYKALFALAETRAQWLAMLLGRPYGANTVGDSGASLSELIGALQRSTPTGAAFRRAHDRVVSQLAALAMLTGSSDRRALARLHRRFFDEQLDITFQLRRPSRQSYPSLRTLLLSRSADGKHGGFLASRASYSWVRAMQLENRVIPLVGDLTGHHTLVGIGAQLRRRQLPLGLVYLSNAEQYVFDERRWNRWLSNAAQLPIAEQGLLLRSYVDQGKAHPRQMPGHRMTNTVHLPGAFLARAQQGGFRNYWQVVTSD